MTDPLKASVIIPVYNNAETLRGCLESLFDTSFAGFEVIVVDDASKDGSADIVEGFPRVSLIRCAVNGGAARARNIGVKAARGKVLLFTDGDCAPQKDWAVAAAGLFEERKRVIPRFAGFTGRIVPAGNYLQRADAYTLFGYALGGRERRSDSLITGNAAIAREAFESVGGFDESLRREEDRDMALRLLGRGYDLYFEPSVSVRHTPKRGTLRRFCGYNYDLGKEVGLRNETRYPRHRPVPRWVRPQNPVLYAFLVPFLACAITAKILLWNLRRSPAVVWYLPMVFLGKVCWRLGALAWLARRRPQAGAEFPSGQRYI